ncbi:MAG: 4Fe-4S binding protein [Bacteriovoracaceae bacterium]|nr:4Fe-4S binding protein [Bacteriovoracaceae bacterium]
MIINRKIYNGVGYLTVAVKTLVFGVGRLIKSIFLLEKSDTYRVLERDELHDLVLFPRVIKNDSSRCDFCSDCSKICPTGSLKVERNRVQCDLSVCTRCGLCLEECPKGVLEMTGEYSVTSKERKGSTVNIMF